MTPKINEKMKDNLISLKRLGYKVMAFYSITNFEDLEKISILKEMDIRCISFNEALG